MTELKELIYKRGKVKSSLTRFETFLNKPGIENTQLECRLQNIEKLLDDFNTIQYSIERLSNEDDLENEEIVQTQFEDMYYDLLAKGKMLIMNNLSNSNVNPVTVGQQSSSESALSNIRLPALDLPKFNGSYNNWLNFHDTFDKLIHQNTKLADSQKLHYLQSCLEGDASTVIQTLDVNNVSYSVAWDLLKERFNNKRIIIRTHVKGIFNLDPLSKESHIHLRRLIDNFKKHVRSLAALGEPTQHWDTLLIYILANKLDPNTRREWEKVCVTNNCTLVDDFLVFLTEKCSVLETVSMESEFN